MKISVLGSGAFGLAIASLLSKNKNNNIIIKYFFILIKSYILNNSSQYAQYLACNKIKLSQDCLLLIISLLSLTV